MRTLAGISVRGTPRNQMERAEVMEKARDLVAPVLERDKAERLIATMDGIEGVGDVRGLRALLQRR